MPIAHFTNPFDALVHAQRHPVDFAALVIENSDTDYHVRAVTEATWKAQPLSELLKRENAVAWCVHDEVQAPFETI